MILFLVALVGCAEELPIDDGGSVEAQFGPLDEEDADNGDDGDVTDDPEAEEGERDIAKATSKTYYVSNPTSDCSSALRLTASGSSITSILPTSSTGATFDTKTSAGTASLSDTWYCDTSGVCDKDRASATGCGLLGTVTVRVVAATSISRLQYWFTDCTCPDSVYD